MNAVEESVQEKLNYVLMNLRYRQTWKEQMAMSDEDAMEVLVEMGYLRPLPKRGDKEASHD
jgi:hypothetical protein